MNSSRKVLQRKRVEDIPGEKITTNEDRLKELSGTALAVFLFMAQMNHTLLSPVQWHDWLSSEHKEEIIKGRSVNYSARSPKITVCLEPRS